MRWVKVRRSTKGLMQVKGLISLRVKLSGEKRVSALHILAVNNYFQMFMKSLKIISPSFTLIFKWQ